MIIIIIIVKIIAFFIAFWGTIDYIIIKIIFIIIDMISFVFFCNFFPWLFFSLVCNIQIQYHYCFRYIQFVFYNAIFFFLLKKILVVFCGDLLSHLFLTFFFNIPFSNANFCYSFFVNWVNFCFVVCFCFFLLLFFE